VTYADTQIALGLWKRKKAPLSGKTARKKHWCIQCAQKGYKVKMDYQGNFRERSANAMYNYDLYECPRCKYLGKEYVRIAGKGKSRNDYGKLLGGE